MSSVFSFDPFHRGNGNGSRNAEDDWLDAASIFDNEWGSTAATTFNPDGKDGYGDPLPKKKRQKFEDLYHLHNGKGESTRKETIRQSHIMNDARMFMSVLEMPKSQRQRVLQILKELDISSNNFGGRKYEKIILALCSLVSDEALTRRLEQEGRPSAVDNRLFLTDEFRDLMTSVGMSNREHRQIRVQIRNKSEEY